jgi:dephospho-CoA kinase
MKIIGIGGLVRSGKDTLADLFKDNDYFGFSFGDFTRENALKRHADKPDPISVANMTETSNWLRDTYGPDVILNAALKKFEEEQAKGKNYKGLVLFSVRAPVEVDWILSHGGELIWVEASDEARYQRSLANLREGEPKLSLEEFKAHEALQWQPQPDIPKEVQMDISYVKSKATKVLENNGTKEEFLDKAHKLIAQTDK